MTTEHSGVAMAQELADESVRGGLVRVPRGASWGYWRRRKFGARDALEKALAGAVDLRERLQEVDPASIEAEVLRGTAVTMAARGVEVEAGGRELLLALEAFARAEPDAGPRLVDELIAALDDEHRRRYEERRQ